MTYRMEQAQRAGRRRVWCREDFFSEKLSNGLTSLCSGIRPPKRAVAGCWDTELNVDEVVRVDNKIQNVKWATWRNSFALACMFLKMVIDRRRVCLKPNTKARSRYIYPLSIAETNAIAFTVHSSNRLIRTNLCE